MDENDIQMFNEDIEVALQRVRDFQKRGLDIGTFIRVTNVLHYVRSLMPTVDESTEQRRMAKARLN